MTDTPPALDAEHTALLVMDYQPAILTQISDHETLLARMSDAINTARQHGAHVAYVRVAFADEDYQNIPAANKMFAPIAENRLMHHEAPETAVHPHVAPEPGDIIVRKTRVGAFSTTDLDQQLKEHGVTTIILAGVSTSGVVLSTVRDAADRDYHVYVLTDASADPDPHVHDVLTDKVLPMQAHLITVAELDGLLADR
jgi:nicotinamidase-related amidase